MSLVLFNIGWMNHYRGQTPSDGIFNGGSYVAEHDTGHEVRNFEPANGSCYGYVRAPRGKINMMRLGAGADAEYADNMTVVFTATPPDPEGGSVVVGWYRNARVWRELQRRDDYDLGFVAEAAQEDCRLLRVDDRVFPVLRAGTEGAPECAFVMGQSNVRYTDDEGEGAEQFLNHLNRYMENPATADVPTPLGAPRQCDPGLRAKVEKAAVRHVIDHWPYPGYECVSVESDNKGWDLEFTRGARTLLVEVKGRSGDIAQVELTPNEYAAMCSRHHRDMYRLAIVTRALVAPRLSIIRFNGSDETWRDQDDREVCPEERTGVIVRTDAPDG